MSPVEEEPTMSHTPSDPRRRHSAPVVDGPGKAASRAMLRAVGFTDADFARPQVGIASTWSNLTPCNSHIDELARHASDGADGAGGKGRSEEHTSELQSRPHLVCRLLLEKK